MERQKQDDVRGETSAGAPPPSPPTTCAGGDSVRADTLTLCDLGDEEVHFSRNPNSELYYYCNGNNEQNAGQVGNQLKTRQQAARQNSMPCTTLDANFSDLQTGLAAGGGGYLPLAGATPAAATESRQDQIKSSRLLNSIGNKLRRGSNYLLAPKLVGQYLLGITIQSWAEFFNTSRLLKAPANRHQLTRRLLSNLSYFQGNYMCISLVLVIYCILTLPLLLLAIAAYLAALYFVTVRSALGKQTNLLGYRLNLQQLYSLITMISLPLLWVAGAPSAVFWVIGASFFVVGLHASTYASNERQLADQFSCEQTNSPASYLAAYNSQQHQVACTGNSNLFGGQVSYSQLNSNQAPARQQHYYDHYATSGPQQAFAYFGLIGQLNNSTSLNASSDTSSSRGQQKATSSRHLAEVKIISQDYAGLGRVYEV